MEQAAGDVLTDLSSKSPYIAMFVVLVLGAYFIWTKWGRKDTSCLDCEKLKFYKDEFIKIVEGLDKMGNSICMANDKLELISKKIDENAKEQKEFFERLIKKDDAQNEILNEIGKVVAKLSANVEIHSQMLINILNKN